MPARANTTCKSSILHTNTSILTIFNRHTCESFAMMVNRNDAVGSDEWRELPIEQQMAWRIPIEVRISTTLVSFGKLIAS